MSDGLTDEEINRDADKQCRLIDEILGHHAATRDGLRLQYRAMIVDGCDDWSDETKWFVPSVASFLSLVSLELPAALAADLFGWGF